jgi:chromosome segregation ATPase
LRQSARELAEANRTREAQAQEIRKLNGLYEETTYAASARQIELVARESEVEKLAGDSSRMKTRQRDIERRLEEADGERKAAVKALAEEKRRAAELERKVERLLATLADRDESIGRQQREPARGQGATAAAADEPEDGGAGSGRRARLETRLATLMRENKKLRSRLAEGSEPAPAAALREEIADLAAQVVNMTILLEGKDSAAARAIAQSGKPPASAGGTTSLADRVRALQQAAASR